MKSLVIKYLEGRISSKEQNELLSLLKNKENRAIFNQISKEWESKRLEKGISPEYLLGWANLQSKLLKETENEHKKQLSFYRILSYAAILILLISTPILWGTLYQPKEKSKVCYSQVSTENGQISNILLPDGTEVWLNAGSSIRYNNFFSIENRNVELIGEAFFKATKNKQLPMIISCSDIKVKVLGTSFNVMSYPKNNYIQVTLEEGEVSLYNNTAPDEVTQIHPGQMATYLKRNNQITIDSVNTVLFTSWKEGILNFNNLTLEAVANKLYRHYNQKFEIDEAAKNLRNTFTIKNETLPQVLDLLKIINPVDPVQKGDTIYLKFNPKRAAELNQTK